MFFYLHFACLCFCESPLAEEKEGLANTWASEFVKIKLGRDPNGDVEDKMNMFEVSWKQHVAIPLASACISLAKHISTRRKRSVATRATHVVGW